MDYCILTIIKDEQDYLDEFIKYHLDLGIGHIFVIEDVNSKSHKHITDKYDSVTLINAIDYKRSDGCVPRQGGLLQIGLKHIKEKYNFNWCFILDIDEFITLEREGSTIDSVMTLYNDYDAIVIQWQNYGANGMIYKPDYSHKGVIDTYTKKTGMAKSDRNMHSVKVVYNLERFAAKMFLNHHIPSNRAKWCKTDFSKDLEIPSFDNIYLRHYLTKSWEEFIWKMYIRGMFNKNHRTYEDFFSMNEDMIDKKEELLQIARNMTGLTEKQMRKK